eukprot:gene14522-19495_t
MSFVASSENWGKEATARLCKIVVDSNDGMAQQIIENRTDLLDLLSLQELERTDDLGMSLPYLCVYYDRPDMLYYLHKRGFDLSVPCDPLNYGNVLFYAVNMGKSTLIHLLDQLGCDIDAPCETMFSQKPIEYAKRIDDKVMVELISELIKTKSISSVLIQKMFRMTKHRKIFVKQKFAIMTIQRIWRGISTRKKLNKQIDDKFV